MDTEIEKSCKNCRYYCQHYVKSDKKFVAANCGHCKKRVGKSLEICRHWESMEIVLEKRKRSIINTIEDMAKRLNEITEVLTDNE